MRQVEHYNSCSDTSKPPVHRSAPAVTTMFFRCQMWKQALVTIATACLSASYIARCAPGPLGELQCVLGAFSATPAGFLITIYPM